MEGKPGPFKVPDERTRMDALGPLAGAGWSVKKSLDTIIKYFGPIPKPDPSDWLANYDEDGQTYGVFASQTKNVPDKTRNTIYIQPLEESIDDDFLLVLQQFCTAFFLGMKIAIRKRLEISKIASVESRLNDDTLQYHAGQILSFLEGQLPKDAFCLIGVMMTDIYPRPSWNFVFGLASWQRRSGVFSFARYDESFFDPTRKKTDKKLIIYRSCRVMSHEISHMFCIRHCIFYNCMMNGSNHLEEASRRISEPCPVCLRKLQSSIKFDILERYRALYAVYTTFDGEFAKEAKWLEPIIAELEGVLKTEPAVVPKPHVLPMPPKAGKK